MPGPPVVAIINSSPDTVEMLSQLFEFAGLVAVSCYTWDIRKGELDLAAFLQQHRPDVIVYDIAPPYERNWRFFEHLRETMLRDCRFVLTSTNARLTKTFIGTDLDIYEVFEKPYALDVILTAVNNALGRPGAPPAAPTPKW